MFRKRLGASLPSSLPGRRRSSERRFARGFTLIEELWFLTFLAIIAGILFPVFTQEENLLGELYDDTIFDILLPALDAPNAALASAAANNSADGEASLLLAKTLSKQALENIANNAEMIAQAMDLDENGSIDEDEYRVVCDIAPLAAFCPPEDEPGTGAVSVEELKLRATKPFPKKLLLERVDKEVQEGAVPEGEGKALKAMFQGTGNDKEFDNYHNLVEKYFASKSSKISHETRLKLHIAAWLVEL